MCCYLDGDGSIYCWERYAELAENGIPSVWKYDASGQEVCRVRMEEGIVPEDICQLSDGRILLLLRNQGSGAVQLAELNAMKGLNIRILQHQVIRFIPFIKLCNLIFNPGRFSYMCSLLWNELGKRNSYQPHTIYG
mgnify:CR=1 FL=1